jgi:hypothetical protein
MVLHPVDDDGGWAESVLFIDRWAEDRERALSAGG